MPAQKPQRPLARVGLVSRNVDNAEDGDLSRAFDDVHRAIVRIEGQIRDRAVLVVNLAVGVNRFNHGLGKKPQGCTVTPTTADATWAWAMTAATDTQLEITTVGVVQTNAVLEIY